MVTSMVMDGGHLFVAGGSTITELDPSTGAFVRTIAGPGYDLSAGPMVADGTDLFVGNDNFANPDHGPSRRSTLSRGSSYV
jgi:hypothetical protein